MFKQLVLSFKMTIASFGMVARFPQVLLLPLCTLAVITAAVVAPAWYALHLLQNDPGALLAFFQLLFTIPLGMWNEGNHEGALSAFAIQGYVMYGLWMTFVTFFVLFFGTAAMHTGTMIVKRQTPSLGAGLAVAWENKWRILGLAAVTATLLTLAKYLFNNTLRHIPILGKWIYRGILFTITMGVYLVLPVLVYERNGPWSAVKSSANLLKKTWGGILVGTGLSFTSFWFAAFAIPIGLIEYYAVADIPLYAYGIYGVVLWAFLYCLNQSLAAMLRAALYWYATTGETPPGVRMDFVPKPQTQRAPPAPLAAAPAGPQAPLPPGGQV